jgi:hypothetical protein
MKICSFTQVCSDPAQCTAALFLAKGNVHWSVLLCKTGSQQCAVTQHMAGTKTAPHADWADDRNFAVAVVPRYGNQMHVVIKSPLHITHRIFLLSLKSALACIHYRYYCS